MRAVEVTNTFSRRHRRRDEAYTAQTRGRRAEHQGALAGASPRYRLEEGQLVHCQLKHVALTRALRMPHTRT